MTGNACVKTAGVTKDETAATADTHIPVPFASFLPRHGGVEWVNPIVGYVSADTEIAVKRQDDVGCYVKHVGFTETVLI